MKDKLTESTLESFKKLVSFDINDFSYHKDLPYSKLDFWKNFYQLLLEDNFIEDNLIFRGQSNAEWGLIPSLNRLNNEPEEIIIKETLISTSLLVF